MALRWLGIVAIVGLAVVCGLVSHAQPSGTGIVDAVWNTICAVVVIAAATRAGRWPLLWMLAIAAVLGVVGGVAAATAASAALVLLGILAWSTRISGSRARALGGVAGAVGLVAIGNAPSFGPMGTPTVIAVLAFGPIVVSGWSTLGRRWRRSTMLGAAVVVAVVVAGASTAALAAMSSRRPIEAAQQQAQTALDRLADGDTAAAAAGFGAAATDFRRVRTIADGPLGWFGRGVPVIAQHLAVLREVGSTGVRLATSARDAASTADWRTLTASGGRVNLAAIERMLGPARDAADATAAALDAIASVRSPWLIGPVTARLDALDREIVDVDRRARVAAAGLAVAPDLLGGNGPRRYLLALATPGESRNGGGFVGSFGIVSTDAGALSFDSSRSTRDLASPASRVGRLDLPPDWEVRYGSMHVGNFPGNLSASPSWPIDADVAGQIAALNPSIGPVDGVVYADPIALAALLDLTGPVRVPSLGRDLDSTTVVQYLLLDQYVRFSRDNDQRLDALNDVTTAVFTALVDRPLPGLGQLGAVLGPVVAGGHLRVATFGSPADAAFLEAIDLDGAWHTRTGADYLSLRSANMLPTKIDVFMSRDVSVNIDFDPDTGSVRSEVRATITNAAPARGLPAYVIGSGVLAPVGTNRNLLSLYTPLDVDAVTIDGAPEGAQVQSEFGGHVISVPVDIGPGSSVEVTWRLRGRIDRGSDYRLDVLPPSLAVADHLRIAVAGADPSVIFDGPLGATERFDVPVGRR